MDFSKDFQKQQEHFEGQTAYTNGHANGSSGNATNGLHNVAEKDHALPDGNFLETGTSKNLSSDHREYLINRHGTLDLEPPPTIDPADPLNWPSYGNGSTGSSPLSTESNLSYTSSFLLKLFTSATVTDLYPTSPPSAGTT